MGGSGGGGGYIPPTPENIEEKIAELRANEQARLDEDVNKFLQDLLAMSNDRDADATREKLNALTSLLKDVCDVEGLILGGSVSKQTYVEGQSDVDALAVLKDGTPDAMNPKQTLDRFFDYLKEKVSGTAEVSKGNLAVTIRYDDGTEIQVLPALRNKTSIAIPNETGTKWNLTKPKNFTKELTRQNGRLNNALVPAIKLLKRINNSQPEQKRISNYHVEALALSAVSGYRGASTCRALVPHILSAASKTVLSPMPDSTGQSKHIDSNLGKANSIQRKVVAQNLESIGRRLGNATNIAQWKRIFKED